MRRILAVPVAAALALVGTTLAPSAHAAPDETVVRNLVTPLSVAVSDDGTVFVAQNFAGMLTMKAPGSQKEVIYALEGSEVGAVSVVGGATRTVTFATTGMGRKPKAHLRTLTENPGSEDGWDHAKVANLYAYEENANPDGTNRYGFTGLPRSCKRKLPDFVKPYDGIVESHPYATTSGGPGLTYVADAAGNSILAVTASGDVSTVAVLPTVPVKIKKKAQLNFGLPRCVRGEEYHFEFVPTDVEMGGDGNLYVTSLPGGPEDGSLGANGGVYRVTPPGHMGRGFQPGTVTKVAGDLVSPTGLAIDPGGMQYYVTSLFTGEITVHSWEGGRGTFDQVPFPGDIEMGSDGSIYATLTDITNEGGKPKGKVVRWLGLT